MTGVIDLNGDLGESFGVYAFGMDDEVLKLVSSANIACGFHAGDPRVMERTVTRAAERGVGIGAHVGFPDLVGFGRRPLEATAEELRTDVLYQIGAVFAFCRALGVDLQHVKPHGALYNLATVDKAVAAAIVAAIAAFDHDLILVALPDSELARAGVDAGLRVAHEGFADRNYNADGTLVDRRREEALILDPAVAAARMVRLVCEGLLAAVDGTDLVTSVHTICIHGDNPHAIAFARDVRAHLEETGVRIAPMTEVLAWNRGS